MHVIGRTKTIVMSGGGLSCWYVTERLHRAGIPVNVWSAETGQVDEPLETAFLDRMAALGVPVIRQELRPELGRIGLEIARAQARLRNGYWNTTGALRLALVTACADWQRAAGLDEAATGLAHGCVGLGNDQRRFNRLFRALRPAQTVQTCLADWSAAGERLSRDVMARALTDWTGLPATLFAPRALWSSDGSILGVSHEGTLVEDHRSDWTTAPFAMTRDPLSDPFVEDVRLEFRAGQLLAIGARSGTAELLLAEANRLAGAHGIGRIGVMEDRLKGTKCRGIYEAPGLTLLGQAWAGLQDLCLPADALVELDALSAEIAADIYSGNWHAPPAGNRRARMDALCADLSGSVVLSLRGGHVILRRVEADAVGIERRFASGGVAWSETTAAPAQHVEGEAQGPGLSVLTGPSHAVPPGHETLFKAIARQCVQKPDAVALAHGDQAISYGQLGRNAAAIAAAVQAAGLRPGTLVPVVTAGGPAMIAAMLGLWAARAAFAPIDAEAPASRREMSLSVIAEASRGQRIALVDGAAAAVPGWTCILLSDVLAKVPAGEQSGEQSGQQALAEAAQTLVPDQGPAPDDLAYGFFTSGSTGVPKCCLNIHSGLANRAVAMTRRFGLGTGEAVLQNSSHVFDSSLWQIFWPLSVGAKVVIPERDGILDLQATLTQIAAHSVRMTDFVPSIMERLVQMMRHSGTARQQFASVRTLLVGGEALGLGLLEDLRQLFPDLQLVNTYGPTEASIGMVFHLFDGSETRIPLGLPIDNCALAVVGPDMRPLPRGETGQIVIGGACMGLGYLGLPERSAEVFLTQTGLKLGSATVYCTGDLGHVDADGLLYFDGRIDDQVKIGGLRIEPGEIEHRMRAFPGVDRAKVVPVQREGETWLAGFVTASEAISPQALRAFLRAELGSASVPALLRQVADFPTTASGKIDARALVASECAAPLQPAPPPCPDGDLQRLMAIAQKALPGQVFGPTDDLGLLGLDSLAALSLVLEAEQLTGCSISLQAFLETPTLAALLAKRPAAAERASCADAQVLADIARLGRPDGPLPDHGANTAPEGPILLTGATGYVGAALLAALLDAGAPQVICLVRAADPAAAAARLSSVLPKPADAERVRVLVGDLSDAHAWQSALPARLSAVLHAAADVNLSRSYDQLRAANLEATARMCQIAADRGAVLHHVSSVAVFGGGALRADGTGRMPDPDIAISALKSGYARSKWAAEQVVIARRDAGLKAAIYRLGEMAPDALYPRTNPLSSLSILAEAARRTGALPLLDEVMDCTPTGLVAAWIAKRCLAGAVEPSEPCAHLLVDPTRHAVTAVLEGMTGPLPRLGVEAFTAQLALQQARAPHPDLARALVLMRSATEGPLFQPTDRPGATGGRAVALPWPGAARASGPDRPRPTAAGHLSVLTDASARTAAPYQDVAHGEAVS